LDLQALARNDRIVFCGAVRSFFKRTGRLRAETFGDTPGTESWLPGIDLVLGISHHENHRFGRKVGLLLVLTTIS